MANKYNLSHDTTYKVISSNYLSILDGGGTSCDNCNKLITTTVEIEDASGKQFTVGADCALTLSGIGELDERKIKDVVKRCKKFYTTLKKDDSLLIKESDESYFLFKIVTHGYDGKPIPNPFISVPFIGIEKDKLSEKFKDKIRTKAWIIENYPELINNYYIQKWQ